jgi:hypothetical protein
VPSTPTLGLEDAGLDEAAESNGDDRVRVHRGPRTRHGTMSTAAPTEMGTARDDDGVTRIRAGGVPIYDDEF